MRVNRRVTWFQLEFQIVVLTQYILPNTHMYYQLSLALPRQNDSPSRARDFLVRSVIRRTNSSLLLTVPPALIPERDGLFNPSNKGMVMP